jgi:glyoxylase-like metal-dependent hydrolase (beta-lactamase superfamily II)
LDESERPTPSVTTVEDGETLTVGGKRLQVVHAPGHTAGHCLFELDGGEEAFAGDALLPEYTPNVGGADVRLDRPLERYLRTLRSIADADYRRVWPGHRDPIDDPTGRAREIIRHHEERAYRVLDALGRLGPCSVWAVSADLFGELSGIHILHGPGECYAHLEHLEADGLVTVENGEYRLTEGTAERTRRDDERWPLEG